MNWAAFEIDHEGCQLVREGTRVPLEPRALALLRYFSQHPLRLLSRGELVEQVWHGRELSDGVLANTVAKLRKALGQPAGTCAPIETVHGRGYRWLPGPRPAAGEGALGQLDWGRREVFAQLQAALERAAEGCGQAVLLAGEAGSGKSCLLAALEHAACEQGFRVWRGNAYAGNGAPPYWPWVEVLRAAGEVERARGLERLIWGRESPSLGFRFKLFDELARLLHTASRESPLLIALEDLHWADAPSLELTSYAARMLERQRVVVVATAREPTDARVQELARELRRIELPPVAAKAAFEHIDPAAPAL